MKLQLLGWILFIIQDCSSYWHQVARLHYQVHDFARGHQVKIKLKLASCNSHRRKNSVSIQAVNLLHSSLADEELIKRMVFDNNNSVFAAVSVAAFTGRTLKISGEDLRKRIMNFTDYMEVSTQRDGDLHVFTNYFC